VQSDPIGLNGGLNTYVYANADPIRHVDPTGESAVVRVLPWAGGAAVADGPLPVGDIVAGLLLGGALIYDMCTDQKCPPCKTVSGRIVAVGTIGYRPLDVIPDDVRQHGVFGSHHNLFKANQMPAPKCDCFWQKLKDVAKPGDLQPNWIPIEPFVN
jgi:hypothetical protein